MKQYRIAEARSLQDIMQMRVVRNEVAGYMTHNSNQIGVFEQLRWYFTQYRPKTRKGLMYGYVVYYLDFPIGYGLITTREGKWWVSGGLTRSVRGSGIGKMLFQHMLTQLYDTDVWLDVRADNTPARRLYHKLGFQRVSVADGVEVMVRRGGVA